MAFSAARSPKNLETSRSSRVTLLRGAPAGIRLERRRCALLQVLHQAGLEFQPLFPVVLFRNLAGGKELVQVGQRIEQSFRFGAQTLPASLPPDQCGPAAFHAPPFLGDANPQA